MDWETDEIDLPQNSDCSKLGDQNNKMDEEEEKHAPLAERLQSVRRTSFTDNHTHNSNWNLGRFSF
ncbi:hypothetical protein PPACK8108_LOCUS10735 [Phakopsora pachyrhizi]|uniref:Uncharacterized protein n=1 Tax=Phakopsora pachyrhizi TaxID=170000 RepID=A0AAV0B0N6_PHAPC|nr:hypothetical protein PPACK8108_LOCUS10735 [Phakopsora pachyrhizi]